MTEWKARRVGDRVLCGRRVPRDGPYACMGVIATIVRDVADHERILPRAGLFAEYGDGIEGPRLREKTRTRFRGDLSMSVLRQIRQPRSGDSVAIMPPFWAPCSHGGHANEVPDDIPLEDERRRRRADLL